MNLLANLRLKTHPKTDAEKHNNEMQNGSQNGAKMEPKWHRIGSGGSRWSQNVTNMEPKWCQSGAKGRSGVDPGAPRAQVEPKWSQNGAKMMKHGAKMEPKWSQTGPKRDAN